MTGSSTITPAASHQDLVALRPLVRAHIEFEGSDAVIPDRWEQKTVELIRTNVLVILIARVQQEAIGYASMTRDVATWTAAPFAHLDCLYVHQAHRGLGIGRQLIDAVIVRAHEQGCREVQWHTPPWNTSAIRFYERLGATRAAKTRFRLTLQ